MLPNGPAIKGGCVTRRKHRAESWYFSRKLSRCKEGMARRFCSPGTNFIEHYVCRGTKLVASHIFIPGYKFGYEHWRGRGINSYKSVLSAGAKAKTMTSLFTLALMKKA